MIARRFSALGWVAGIASAATGLYLVSLQVAAERAKLEEVEARIVATHREIRQLQTELGTRASLRQLEKWNGESLSLTAPRATQFLGAEYQLAALDRHVPDAVAAPVPVRSAALVAAVPAPPADAAVANIARAAYVVTPGSTAPKASLETTPLRTAAAVRPTPARRADAANVPSKKRVVDRVTLGELVRTAAIEDNRQASKRQ